MIAETSTRTYRFDRFCACGEWVPLYGTCAATTPTVTGYDYADGLDGRPLVIADWYCLECSNMGRGS